MSTTPTANVKYKNHLWNDRNKRAGKEELVSAKKEKRGIKEEIITGGIAIMRGGWVSRGRSFAGERWGDGKG